MIGFRGVFVRQHFFHKFIAKWNVLLRNFHCLIFFLLLHIRRFNRFFWKILHLNWHFYSLTWKFNFNFYLFVHPIINNNEQARNHNILHLLSQNLTPKVCNTILQNLVYLLFFWNFNFFALNLKDAYRI